MKFPNTFNSAAAYKNFVRYQKKQEKDWKNHTERYALLSFDVRAAYGRVGRAESEKKMVRTTPELSIIGGADLPAKKSAMSSITRGRDFNQMVAAQKATFLLALFSMLQSASATPLSRRDGAVAKENKVLDRVDPTSMATKVYRQKKNAVAMPSSPHSLAQHNVGLFLMRAYVSKKSPSSNEASVEILAQSKSTAPLEKKSHQRRATQVISDRGAAQPSHNTRANDGSVACPFSENSMELIAAQSEVAAAVIMNNEIFRGLSGNATLTPGNSTDLSIDPIRNNIDFPVRIECIETIATTFLVFKKIEAWVDFSRASTQISNPYQAFFVIAARAGYPDDHLSIEDLGQALAQGKNINDWFTEASVEQQHQFHQAALLYMQAKHPHWSVWSSISCFQIKTPYPLSMLRDMENDISRVYDDFAMQVREAWQKSQIFVDSTLNDEVISAHDLLVDGVNSNAANEIPQEPTAPTRCVGNTICFDGIGLVHAQGKTLNDLLGDASLALIPGFAALNRQTQQRLVRERLHGIGQSTEYTFGSIQHSMASTLITLLLIKGQPIPENFGTETALVQRFMTECKQWAQEKHTVSPSHLMALHLASARGEKIFSKKSTPQQRMELINQYAKEVMLANYGEGPKQYIRDQRITTLIMKKFNLTEREVKTKLIESSSCLGNNHCETKWKTPFDRFNQIIDRNAFTDFGSVITFFDGLVNHDIDKIIGVIPVIGSLYNVIQAIETKDWQRGLSALPIIGNTYDMEEGLRTGDAIRTYFSGTNLFVEVGSYHQGAAKSAQLRRILSATELPEYFAHGVQVNSAFSEKVGLSFKGVKIEKLSDGVEQKNNYAPIFSFKDPFGIEKTNIKAFATDDIRVMSEITEENRLQATGDTSRTDISENETWLVCGARVKRAPDDCFSTEEKRSDYFNALKDKMENDEKFSRQKRFAMSEVFKIERNKLSATKRVDLLGEYKKYMAIRKKEINDQFSSEEELTFNRQFVERLVESEQAIFNK